MTSFLFDIYEFISVFKCTTPPTFLMEKNNWEMFIKAKNNIQHTKYNIKNEFANSSNDGNWRYHGI